MAPTTNDSIFISHGTDDLQTARAIYRRLKGEGLQPWMAAIDLLPGQNSERVKAQQLRKARFIIVLFSHQAVQHRGPVQREYKMVLEVMDEVPEDQIAMIPVKIDNCDLPIGFQDFHAVDLGSPGGFEKITAVIRNGLQTTDPPKSAAAPEKSSPEEQPALNGGQNINIGGSVRDSIFITGDGNQVNLGKQRGDSEAPSSAATGRSTRILILAANPHDTAPLRIGHELRAIDENLQRGDYRDQFKLLHHNAVHVQDLQPLLLRHRPQIVHFSGHSTSESKIQLEGNNGYAQAVPKEALSKLFKILKGNIRLVVLNSCYSEAQASAIADHIDCVVGMTNKIDDKSSINFAGAFYQALSFGLSVDEAFALGETQLDLQSLDSGDAPILISRRVNAGTVKFTQ